MKLDEGASYEKLSLDITPLIDIVFLLVLFFAVSTSFISSEDLEALKSNLLGLSEDKAALTEEVTTTTDRLRELELTIISLKQDRDSERARVQALQTQVVTEESARRGLQQQTLSLQQQNQDLSGQLDQVSAELNAERAALSQQRDIVVDLKDLLTEKQQEAEDLQLGLAAEQQRNETLQADLALADQAYDSLSADASAARAELQSLNTELEKYRQIAELDREQIERVLKAQRDLESDLDSYLQSKQVGIKRDKQRITVQLSDQILFDSGSPELKPEGIKLLRDVGNALRDRLGNLRIQIGGHTDNIPVGRKNTPWPSNWALSAARAVNVVRLLEDEAGIDSSLLSAVGFGEHRPIADNSSAEGRARNRRIEIVLLPR